MGFFSFSFFGLVGYAHFSNLMIKHYLSYHNDHKTANQVIGADLGNEFLTHFPQFINRVGAGYVHFYFI